MLIGHHFARRRYLIPGFIIGVILFLPWAILARDYKKETEFLHRVVPGESLSKIARQYFALTEAHTVGELIQKIQERNGLKGTVIRPDQHLLIPAVRSAPVVAKTIPKPREFEARGIYVNRYSMASQKMPRLIDRLIALGGNTVILDGKDMSGRISYPSRVDLASQIGADATPLVEDPSKLFHLLHKRGLHVCVRLVLFHDPFLAAKRPDMAIRSITTGAPWKENGRVAWVDPSNPGVQEYNLAIAKELAELGVDEIQFDYIRFPTMGNTWDAAYGFDEQKVPKHEVITAFLARAQEQLAPHEVLLSIDVFGVMGWERPQDLQMTGQKVEELAQYCDVISPMIYPSHFYGSFQGMKNPGDQPFFFVSEACRRFSTIVDGKAVTLRPWIQAFPLGTSRFDEAYILEELRALKESEACGWLLWSAGNAYDVAWKALAEWNRPALGQERLRARYSFLDGQKSQ
jgi:hypothetical protein